MTSSERRKAEPEESPKVPVVVLTLLALAFWISAIAMMVIGFSSEDLSFLRWAAIPDAIAALVASIFAIRRSIVE